MMAAMMPWLNYGSGGIRTHAPEETGALNQRLGPLGHATVSHRQTHPVNFFDKIMGKKQIQDIVQVDRFRGAMVARLTPDQEVACSSHVGIRGVDAIPDHQLSCQNPL